MKDEENQKNGVVVIYYGVGQTERKNRTSLYWKLWWGLPLRHVGMHHCQDTSVLNPVHVIMTKLMENDPLCRFRFHTGM